MSGPASTTAAQQQETPMHNHGDEDHHTWVARLTHTQTHNDTQQHAHTLQRYSIRTQTATGGPTDDGDTPQRHNKANNNKPAHAHPPITTPGEDPATILPISTGTKPVLCWVVFVLFVGVNV